MQWIADAVHVDVPAVIARAKELGHKRVRSSKSAVKPDDAHAIILSFRKVDDEAVENFRLEMDLGGIFHNFDRPSKGFAKGLNILDRSFLPDGKHNYYAGLIQAIDAEGLENAKSRLSELRRELAVLRKQNTDEYELFEKEHECTTLASNLELYHEYKQLAELWSSAPDLSTDELNTVLGRLYVSNLWFDLFDSAIDHLDEHLALMLMTKGDVLLRSLSRRVEKNDIFALRVLVHFACQATRLLNDAPDTPALKEVKKQAAAWPVFYSPHFHFRTEVEPPLRQLGETLPFPIYRGAKWNPNELGSRIAARLLENLVTARTRIKGAREHFVPTGFERKILDLPELPTYPDTLPTQKAVLWWNLAKTLFSRYYPQSIHYPAIRRLSVTARKIDAGEVGRKEEKRVNGEIVNNVREKFLEMLRVKKN